MAGFTVEYIIALRDAFSAAAERVAKAAADAKTSIGNMGKAATEIDGQMAKAAAGMNRVAAGAEKAAQGVGAFTKANSRAAQESARFTELQIKSMNRIEKMEQGMYERHVARQNLIKSGAIPGPKEKGSGVGFMGGLFALSMLHNDVTKTWADFDDEFRKIRGTMAGQIDDVQLAALRKSAMDTARGTIFGPSEIAKVMMAEAERGVPIGARTKSGELLGSVVARQMLGIATATGEDPAETFKTHLMIAQGFGMKPEEFAEKFPHISDTIARIHQKTGITMGQITSQMGQISAVAHAAGWTEEQTVGAVGFLAKRGMGQFAGSGLSRMITKTLNWTKEGATFWKALGLHKSDLTDKDGKVLGPEEFADVVGKAAAKLSPAQRAAAFNKMFGDRGQKVAQAIAAAFDGTNKNELRAMIEDLKNVDGLAEMMGLEGSKGGAAGLKRFATAWERLKVSVGESGFGEHVGQLASKFGELMDAITGKTVVHGSRGHGTTSTDAHPWLLEAAGWTAAALNMLSVAAMPLLALSALGPMIAGLARITGISAALRGIGGAAAGIWASVGALRALSLISGTGALIFLGYEIYQHWDQVKKVLSEVWALMKNIAAGNKTGARANAEAITQAAGFGDRHSAQLDNMRFNARRRHHGIDVIGIEGRSYLATQERMRHAQDLIAEAEALKAKYHPKPSPTFHGFGPRGGGASAADAAAAGRNAAAQRIQADVQVRSTIDPIELKVPASVTLKGTLSGLNGLTANVNGEMPLAASAPRGQSMAEPAAPRVSK